MVTRASRIESKSCHGTLFEYTHIVANGALHEFTYAYDLDEEASK